MPDHVARRRPALPALLLTVAGAALCALALLPGPAGAPTVAAVQPAAATAVQGSTESAAVLGRPPVLRTVAPPVAKHRPAKRASRRRVVAAAVPAGYACPVRGQVSYTDSWGDPRPGGRHHEGTDVLATYGAPVVAVISGTIQTNYSRNGGISLYLRGVDGDEYFYAHNSRNLVIDGQRVVTGQVIALVGTTGDARGGPPHVHFERHPGGGAPVDPYPFVLRACG